MEPSLTPGSRSEPDPNAPVTIPAWLFQQLMSRTHNPIPNLGISPPDSRDIGPIDRTVYRGSTMRTSPTELGGGGPNPFRQWEPIGRQKKSAEAESDTMQDTPGGD